MKITILDRAKKKKFVAGLSDLGMKKIPQLLIKTGKERVRAYSGSFSNEEIWDVWRLLPIEGIGLYVGKDMINRNGVRDVRLSLDGLHIWKDQITGNVLQLSEEQEAEWFAGKNVEIEGCELQAVNGIPSESGKGIPSLSGSFVAVKSSSGDDFIGTGKIGAEGKTLFNFLPKERRRKSQTI